MSIVAVISVWKWNDLVACSAYRTHITYASWTHLQCVSVFRPKVKTPICFYGRHTNPILIGKSFVKGEDYRSGKIYNFFPNTVYGSCCFYNHNCTLRGQFRLTYYFINFETGAHPGHRPFASRKKKFVIEYRPFAPKVKNKFLLTPHLCKNLPA